MGKKIIQFAAVLLAAVTCLSTVAWAADTPGMERVRVGLYYDADALPGANLENSVGAGYRFGFFDGNGQFLQVGWTGETQISVVKTQNVWFNGSNYTDTPTDRAAVGCYHIQLPTVYPTFEDAKAAAETVGGTGFPAWIDGSWYVRSGSYLDKASADAALAAWGVQGTVAGTSAYGVSVVKTGSDLPLFQFDGGEGRALAVRPGLDDTEKTVTWFKGYRYYGDFIYQRQGGGNLTVINDVDLEDYVKGVVPHEMSNSWPLEALKAQAVCARTYAAIHADKHKKYGFDLCSTTDCQVYQGLNGSGESSDRAVEETAGKYAWYNGALAETYYFSCDGGATEDVKNVWGAKDKPYLVGVMDPYEPTVADKTGKYNWTVTFTKAELKEILHAKNRMCADIVDFYVAETSPTGNVIKITFVDADGKSWSFRNSEAGKEYCRNLLGLKSIRYTISGGGGTYAVNEGASIPSVRGVYAVDGTGQVVQVDGMPWVVTGSGTEQLQPTQAGDSFTITGSGWGHNVGMSQWGAYAMAQQGKTYDEILKFYFTGIDVK